MCGYRTRRGDERARFHRLACPAGFAALIVAAPVTMGPPHTPDFPAQDHTGDLATSVR
jgi:hypothetical protein